MRQFYLTFPNGYALRDELSWTHYRLLMRVENDNAKESPQAANPLMGWIF